MPVLYLFLPENGAGGWSVARRPPTAEKGREQASAASDGLARVEEVIACMGDDAILALTLKQKLAILVAVVFVPLSIAIAWQLVHLYDHLRTDSVSHARDDALLAVAKVEQLEQNLAARVWTAGAAALVDDLGRQRTRTLFAELSASDPRVRYALFDSEGRLITTASGSGDASVPAPPDSAFRRQTVRAVTTGPAWERGLVVYVPVFEGRKLLGIGAARALRSAIEASLHFTPTGSLVVITDPRGNLVYAGPGTTLSDAEADLLSTVRASLKHGGASTTLPGFHSRHVGVQLPADGLTVGFYATAASAFRHIADEAALLTAALAATVILSAEFARRYANDILVEISTLSSASRRLAVGDFDVELPTGAKDEIGQLASDFSHMRESLQDAFASEATMAEAASKLGQAATIDAVANVALDYTARLLGSNPTAVTVVEPDSEPRVFSLDGGEELAHLAADTFPYSDLGPKVNSTAVQGQAGRLLVSFALRHSDALLGRIDALLPVTSMGDTERSELELVSSIAEQAATSLANVILYEREHLIADTLQDSLLTVLPAVKNLQFGLQYRPATVGMRIGGDFYDFVTTPQGLVVIVGDISGKGLAAARQTSISKGALRSFAIDDPSPDLVLTRANAAITPQFDAGTFVTAFCALIDTASEEISYSTAGHPPPLLVHLDGTVETLMAGGPPLGIVDDAEYSLTRIGFEADETLVIVSDGITEARNAEGELLGERAVAETVSAAAGLDAETIAGRIVSAAEQHATGRLEDDLTVVVVSFAEPLRRTDAAKRGS